MERLKAWWKKWVTDGWLTAGEQIAARPGQALMFARCISCGRVYPHWLASMTADEVKQRGRVGCLCGGLRIQPCLLPAWQSVWWFVVRGWLWRKVITRARLWDPRMVILERDWK